MRSIDKLSQEEKEIKVLISSLKNVLTDVPYDFEWDDEEDSYKEDTYAAG
jgi:hypothetical protein